MPSHWLMDDFLQVEARNLTLREEIDDEDDDEEEDHKNDDEDDEDDEDDDADELEDDGAGYSE